MSIEIPQNIKKFAPRKSNKRLDLGGGDWVDVLPVGTVGISREYNREIYGGEAFTNGQQFKIRVFDQKIVKARLRVAGWHLTELEDDGTVSELEFNEENFEQLSEEMLNLICAFIDELDGVSKKAQGTDNPKN